MNFDYEQHMRFMHLYNTAVAAQELDSRRRQGRRLSRFNSFDRLPMEYDRVGASPPLRRAGSSSSLLDQRRQSVKRVSPESGYSSNREVGGVGHRLSKKNSSLSDTYEGYPQIRRVSVVRKQNSDRPPTPPIIKRKSSSALSSRSSVSPGQSVRFSTVEDISQGVPWSGRYKPRVSVTSDRDSYVDENVFYDGHRRRSSSASRGHHRRSSSASRRDSVSSRRASVSSRRASVSSRRGSVAPGSRRSSKASFSYAPIPDMEVINPHSVEGAEIMRRLSRGGIGLKEWERSTIMSRRSSRSSRRDSRSSRRASTSSRRRSSVGFATSYSSDSDSDSDSDSSSSDDSSTSGSDSSGSYSGSSYSDSESSFDDSENKKTEKMSPSTETTSNNAADGGDVKNGVSAGGVGASPVNGGTAFAMDGGDFKYYQMEEDNSSSVCVIL